MKIYPHSMAFTILTLLSHIWTPSSTLAADNAGFVASTPVTSVNTDIPAKNSSPVEEAPSEKQIESLRTEMKQLTQQVEQLQNNYQYNPAPPIPLDSDREKQSYASGVAMAAAAQRAMSEQQKLGVTLTPALVVQGIRDALNQRPLRMQAEEIRQALEQLDADVQTAQEAALTTQKKLGSEWYDTFKKQPGVITDNGVAYLIQTPGTGALVSATDTVDVRLSGRLVSGEVFSDGSYIRRVKVSALLPAVSAGLEKVHQTGKIRIVVPPEKGYGDEGLYPDIPGGATLIYDAEVTAINNTEPLSAPAKPLPEGEKQEEGLQPDTTEHNTQPEEPPRGDGFPEARQNPPGAQP